MPDTARAAWTPTLKRHPCPGQWLRMAGTGELTVLSGKVEIGQGLQRALALIVADELGWPLSRVHVAHPSTSTHPDEGVTSGSLSVQDSGAALRCMAALLRERLCDAAASHWGVPAVAVVLAEGRLSGPGGCEGDAVDFLADRLLSDPMEEPPPLKPREAWRLQGHDSPRPELDRVFAGQPWFLHDLDLPGLLHGRVGAWGARDTTEAIDAVRRMPGVLQVVSSGALRGVLATTSPQAEAALARLLAGAPPAAAAWPQAPHGLNPDDWGAHTADPRVVGEQGLLPDPEALPEGHRLIAAAYTKPWLAHASIGPSCALARWAAEVGRPAAAPGDASLPLLEVWTHSQGPFGLRRDLALAFGLPEDRVVVHHRPGAGCYGHNGADDVAFDAAWLAQQVPRRPVRVLWSRADEFTRAPLGPAMRVELQATVDAQGALTGWRHTLWSPGHSSRPGRSATPSLWGNAQREGGQPLPAPIDMPLAVGGGAERNAVPGYALPAWRVVAHRVTPPWRSSALRSLGAFGNVFAAESFLDEIALAIGQDPLRLRLSLLPHDPRGQAVLQAAAHLARWGDPCTEGGGRGIGYARYKGTGAWCAVVAEVQAGTTLAVKRLNVAVDVGTPIHPDGVVQQIEGAALQATSWALKESVPADAQGRVAVTGWEDYPILSFSELPEVRVHLMPSSAPSLGAGEAAVGPTGAAIANALAAALGVRVRSLPLTPERIVTAIHAQP